MKINNVPNINPGIILFTVNITEFWAGFPFSSLIMGKKSPMNPKCRKMWESKPECNNSPQVA